MTLLKETCSVLLPRKGAKKLGGFAQQQLKHPAVGRCIGDTAAIAAASGFNPEVAVQRFQQEQHRRESILQPEQLDILHI